MRPLLITTCFLFSALPALAVGGDGHAFFETKIRPVLVEHCHECHSASSSILQGGLRLDSASGLLEGGDSGRVLVKGKPSESLLVEALRYESLEMPPGGKLPEDVVADFEKWIAMGAPDPRAKNAQPQAVSERIDAEAGRDFWAFQPPEAHAVPAIEHREWPHNWIDHFVLARLEENELRPVADAGRATLIRRIAYDLTGLPPSSEDVAKYVCGEEPKPIATYVDQLLGSPRFGEHWGRHWLDVARYADSNGGDFNATFHNAWRYRNHVVDTFNRDRPFRRFIIEQIAGDLLDASTVDERERNLVATGFLMFGAKMLSERDKEKLRMDVVDEQITSVGKAFLGMTLGCARCHDHKFDPVPTTDYYALAGIFRSTQTLDGEIQKYVSNWTRQPLPMTPEHEAALKEHQQLTARLKEEIESAEKRLKRLDSRLSESRVLRQGILLDDTQAKLVGRWKHSTYSKNFIGEGYIHDDKQDLGQKRVIFKTNLPETGQYEVRLAFPGSDGRASNVPVKIVQGDFETTVQVDQTESAPILTMLKPIGRFEFSEDEPVVVEIANIQTDGYVIVDALQIVLVEGLQQQRETEDAGLLAEAKTLRQQIAAFKEELREAETNAPPPAPMALAVRDQTEPSDYFVCIRGEPRNRGEKVTRGFLKAATYEGTPEVAEQQSGRLELARWIADPRHPLSARVYVNRVWHHLLGAGIVRSVDNFGALGERPTHPMLLDQLAVEFINHGWSTKWLVREIMLSRTYQLNSRHEPSRWQADPENRLLWRAHRKPLPAESIRDTMLLASGELNFAPGGPPVDDLGTLVTQNRPDDKGVELQATNLRTLYQPVIRNELPTLMRVFDFADPDFVSGTRSETTVPTQALWMLHSPFVAEQAKRVSRRVVDRDFSTDREAVEFLYVLTLGRPPAEDESRLAIDFLQSSSGNRETNWTDLAHSLLASSAFRMLD